MNRFSKFFHCQKQEKTDNDTVRPRHTSNVSLHYVVSCESSTTSRHFVDRVISQWCHRVECVVQQQLKASTMNILMQKLHDMTVTLDNN